MRSRCRVPRNTSPCQARLGGYTSESELIVIYLFNFSNAISISNVNCMSDGYYYASQIKMLMKHKNRLKSYLAFLLFLIVCGVTVINKVRTGLVYKVITFYILCIAHYH